MGYDLSSDIKVMTVKQNGAIQAGFNSAAVDISGYTSLTFVLPTSNFAFSAANKMAIKAQRSEDKTTWEDLDDLDHIAPRENNNKAWDRVFDGPSTGGKFGVRLTAHRYYRIVGTETGAVSYTGSVEAVLGHPRVCPVPAD